MIDEDFKVYLIEVNTNPCLELSSPLLSRIIPAVIDNVFRYIKYIPIQNPLELLLIHYFLHLICGVQKSA
jgi:hypothetical protein